MARLLVIDDDPRVRKILLAHIQKMGHHGTAAEALGPGLDLARSGAFDLVFLDVQLPDGNGLDKIGELRQLPEAPEVIIFTGMDGTQGAELAINNGAWDYLKKPLNQHDIRLNIQRALEYRAARLKSESMPPSDDRPFDRGAIKGTSPKIEACLQKMRQYADSTANVLITGETGCGKELFAQSMHLNSGRRAAPFIVVDCAALPQNLVESVLFGHAKGAFTGADAAREGLVTKADGGTLFLDEVGELPLSIQKAFLRVLQEKRFRPVGSGNEIKSDFRLIAATNRDLAQMAAKGDFREDLLYRIQSVHLHLPPLRERREDIKDLAQGFLFKLCAQYRMEVKGFVPEFIEVLESFDWPGNVRELANTMEEAILAARTRPILFPADLPAKVRIAHAQGGQPAATPAGPQPETVKADVLERLHPSQELPAYKEFRGEVLEEIMPRYFERLARDSQGDIKNACRLSGLSRARLYVLLKEYGVSLAVADQ